MEGRVICIYIKGLDMPKEGECDIIAIHGNGEVCRWFAERNNELIAEAEEYREGSRYGCSKVS